MRAVSRSAGFSLLEVILALAILAGAMVILGELARQGLRYAERARDVTQAQMICESKLAEVTSASTAPSASAAAPVETDPSNTQKWLCSVDVSPLSQQGLLAVRVTVTKDAADQAQPLEVSLTRWMVDPTATFGQQGTTDDFSNMQETQQ